MHLQFAAQWQKKKKKSPEVKLRRRDICVSFAGKVNQSKCKVMLCDGRLSNV